MGTTNEYFMYYKNNYRNMDDKVIDFLDDGLEKAVRKAINKLEGDIYQSDVKDIKKLDALRN